MTGAALLMLIALWFSLLADFSQEARGIGKNTPTAVLVLTVMSGLMALGIAVVGLVLEMLAREIWSALA